MTERAKPPAEGVLPPGEIGWISYTSMFGGSPAKWDDLSIADKVRWACVEASIVEQVLAQGPVSRTPHPSTVNPSRRRKP